MKLLKVAKTLFVVLTVLQAGCSSSSQGQYELTKENYEQVAERIAKLSVAQCHETVKSVTQDLETCSYAVANYYLEQVAEKNNIQMID